MGRDRQEDAKCAQMRHRVPAQRFVLLACGIPCRMPGLLFYAPGCATLLHLPLFPPSPSRCAVAALQTTSRYGMPWMEGAFNEDPNLDESLDPVGQFSAVRCLFRVFRGVSIEDVKLREKVAAGELEEFTVQEIAIFSTVVRGKERSRRVL